MIIPAHDTPLYSQGKVSYFLIPMGERKLLNQFPKIAGHSQLLGWSPSRGEQREYNPPAGCEWEATKNELGEASQDDSAFSEIFILFFVEQLGVCHFKFLVLFKGKPVSWKWD